VRGEHGKNKKKAPSRGCCVPSEGIDLGNESGDKHKSGRKKERGVGKKRSDTKKNKKPLGRGGGSVFMLSKNRKVCVFKAAMVFHEREKAKPKKKQTAGGKQKTHSNIKEERGGLKKTVGGGILPRGPANFAGVGCPTGNTTRGVQIGRKSSVTRRCGFQRGAKRGGEWKQKNTHLETGQFRGQN